MIMADTMDAKVNTSILMLKMVTIPVRSMYLVRIVRIAKNADSNVVARTDMPISANVQSVFGRNNPPNMEIRTVNKKAEIAKSIGARTSHCLSVVCWLFIKLSLLLLCFYFITICPEDKDVIAVGWISSVNLVWCDINRNVVLDIFLIVYLCHCRRNRSSTPAGSTPAPAAMNKPFPGVKHTLPA